MAARARLGWPAPSQKLARELVAIASDSGSMYSTAAMLAAIWWLADATVPSRAMNKAISVKELTSTRIASPPGTPSRA